jgi:hypothetical protein
MNYRFFVSWIVGAIVMYLAFYAWHGIFLDELSRISYSRGLFFLFAAFSYLVISFLLFKIFEMKLLKKYVSNLFLRGIVAGIILAGVVFVVTRVTGVGIGTSVTLKHLLLDISWQTVEQSLGGMIMALGQLFIFDPELEEEAIRSNNPQ